MQECETEPCEDGSCTNHVPCRWGGGEIPEHRPDDCSVHRNRAEGDQRLADEADFGVTRDARENNGSDLPSCDNEKSDESVDSPNDEVVSIIERNFPYVIEGVL